MLDSADHLSPKTGLSPTVTISKNGAAFASPSGSVTEIGSGWYKVAGNATDNATLGVLLLHATASGADVCDDVFEVVAFDPDAALATPTNITAGTLTTVTTATNVTTVNGLAAGVITAASIAADAITDAKVAADVTIASVTGAVGSVTGNVGGNVTGSVGSVSGNVGGNVVGSVASVAGNVGGTVASVVGNVGGNVTGSVGSVATGGITSASLAADCITAAKIADGAITDAKITFPTEAAGRPTTFLAAMRRLWEWTVNKRTRDTGTGTVLLRNAADSATLETQTQSTSGATDTQTKGA